jgi:hypothetical protein
LYYHLKILIDKGKSIANWVSNGEYYIIVNKNIWKLFNDNHIFLTKGTINSDIDKKHIIWENVNSVCPEVKWLYGKNGNLKKENYDMSDAATAVIGYVNMEKQGTKE